MYLEGCEALARVERHVEYDACTVGNVLGMGLSQIIASLTNTEITYLRLAIDGAIIKTEAVWEDTESTECCIVEEIVLLYRRPVERIEEMERVSCVVSVGGYDESIVYATLHIVGRTCKHEIGTGVAV